ncbi:hypothetical protein WMY93_008766 [Mugilogobius chulae]|uniref:Uncharacterized protein n=1 Tax=Mugilogobius chulae TaxID=88201 RepID=A0AAW0PG15_9GOBI
MTLTEGRVWLVTLRSDHESSGVSNSASTPDEAKASSAVERRRASHEELKKFQLEQRRRRARILPPKSKDTCPPSKRIFSANYRDSVFDSSARIALRIGPTPDRGVS